MILATDHSSGRLSDVRRRLMLPLLLCVMAAGTLALGACKVKTGDGLSAEHHMFHQALR